MSSRADSASHDLAGSPFDSWHLPVLDLDAFRAADAAGQRLLGPKQARYLLTFSLLAPSTHNTLPQAYRLDIERDRIELWLRRRHMLNASDPTGREALISVGCAVENFVQASAQYGIEAVWEVSPSLEWKSVNPANSEPETYVGQLRLGRSEVPDPSARQSALQGMLERRTVRAEFDGAATLPPELRSRLIDCPGPQIRVSLFESASDKFAWAKLAELAMKNKLEDAAFRGELGEWLLPNEDEHSTRGMRGREFGLDDRVTTELSARLRGSTAMPVDQLAFIARAERNGLTNASAICVLSCLDPGPATAIAAGRAFQKCVLLAGSGGFVSAVHTAICHVPHVRAMSEATLLNSLTPSVIFRLGKPRTPGDAARPHSARPPLEDVLIV